MPDKGKGSKPAKKANTSQKATGAGPAMAAHSKDAKSDAKSGQNTKAAKK